MPCKKFCVSSVNMLNKVKMLLIVFIYLLFLIPAPYSSWQRVQCRQGGTVVVEAADNILC